MLKKRGITSRWPKLALIAAVMMGTVLPTGWIPQAKAERADHVVISEAYGGGGNSGAHYKNDFIELYNPTDTAVSLVGWSVQYASATGEKWQATNLTGSIAPYGFYLIQQAAGQGGGTELSFPDDTGKTDLSGTKGKVALVSHTTPLTGTDVSSQAGVADMVGFGDANSSEGNSPAPAPSNTTSAQRISDASGIVPNGGNGWDTNNNGNDFIIGAPTPKNTQSPVEPPLPTDVTEKPNATELIFDHTDPIQATIRGYAGQGRTIKVYASQPTGTGNDTPLAQQDSDASGLIDLTFTNPDPNAQGVYLTATEGSKKESASIELRPAVASPAMIQDKVSLQALNGVGELRGEAGAAAGNAILRAYDPQKQPLMLSNKETGTAQANGSFSFTIPNIDQLDHILVTQQTVGEYGKSFESPEVSVTKSAVGSTTIAEARKTPVGTNVIVVGTVTAMFEAGGQNNVYFQDETAGLVLRAPGLTGKIEVGDKIRATGKMNDYYGLAQLEALTNNVEIVQKQAGVPNPQVVTSTDFATATGEALEGKLVTVKVVTVKSVSSGNYTLEDQHGTFVSRPDASLLLPVNKSYAAITGVVNYDRNVYKLVSRTVADLVEDENKVPMVTASPAGPMVTKGTNVTLTTTMADATIFYTVDGSTPGRGSIKYTGPIQIDTDTTLSAIAVKDGYTDSNIATFRYVIQKDNIRIHDIQGTSHRSPMTDGTVTNIPGIVTAIVKSGSNVQGFYMQDPQPDADPFTSEGIYVYEPKAAVAPGDEVTVSGTVKEYVPSNRAGTDLTQTQIDATSYAVVNPAKGLPDPLILGKDNYEYPKGIIDNDSLGKFDPDQDGIDFWESLEGMLVQIENPIVVGETKTFTNPRATEFVVIDDRAHPNQPRTPAGGVVLEANDFHPERITVSDKLESITGEVKVGDKFDGPLVGIIDYSFANYKLFHTRAFTVQPSHYEQPVTSISPKEDKLTIASYNIENFSAKTDSAKINRIAETIVDNMKAPDIIGVVEMQDDNGPTDNGQTDATQSADALIKAIANKNGPTYRYIDIAPQNNQDGGQPGGNIRVGFFYNQERVQLAAGTPGGATDAVQIETRDGIAHLSHNPGRVDPTNAAFASSRKPLAAEFIFQGEPVIVIANHFNSKGGDQALFGKDQPPQLVSEVQRMKIARVLNNFVKEIHAAEAKANVVVLGDLNDFPFSNPVQELADGVLTNMVEKLPKGEQYTYVYQGNSQVLDQILVSNHLEDDTKVDIVHINAGLTESEGRVSDHNPVLVQLDLKDRGTPEKTAQEVAESITQLTQPAAGETRLKLPEVPTGFTITIKSSSDPAVIALDGKITPPYRQTNVDLVLEVTRASDQSTAETKVLTVQVPAKPDSPPPVTPPDRTPTPDSQRELNKQAAQVISSSNGENAILGQVDQVLSHLEKLLDAKQWTPTEKWETVTDTITTVLEAVTEQAERGIISEETLQDVTKSFLDKAFDPLTEDGIEDEEIARLALASLTSLAKTALEPLDEKDISKEVAKHVRTLAGELLKKLGTVVIEDGDEIKADDEQVDELLDVLGEFMKAIESVKEKIGFAPVLFVQVKEGDDDASDTRSRKGESADPTVTLEQQLVEQLKEKEVGIRVTLDSEAWVEVPGTYFAAQRAREFALALTQANGNGWKGVPNPGEAYQLQVWGNGKKVTNLGKTGFTLGLPVAEDASEKLQAYSYRSNMWRAATGLKGKAIQVTKEDDLGSFTVTTAATYVVGESALKRIEIEPKSLKLAQGEEAQLKVKAILGNDAEEDVTEAAGIEFTSSKPEQVEVDESGRILVLDDAKPRTRVTITISYAGKTAKVTVTVKSN
ncbi:chitobiase/beta-hexosaminidase C-terminal domain-containing protein [Brevibacillus sp. M2.1A]|uniref:chitobiase/beta-hexosaminidase C-terminal domain-containing protein n=1 Tax=Brevibacillus sp. M2.1A TaxID=2738980 RepID=UPI00156AC502|nr:chitobiase/beta-hexosaminidase C-terminal domain-containing protein [Brevibacillus sp. M2.1A]MCC8434780.1 chitobiase/beta-hexosaminidase C-terminal domain-containing protein [Brevibacillus sp. M2.1A]